MPTKGGKGRQEQLGTARYDRWVQEQIQGGAPTTPLTPIFEHIEQIQAFQVYLHPWLQAHLPPSHRAEVANFREGKLIILTAKATTARLLRLHQQELFQILRDHPQLPPTTELHFRITPRLQSKGC